MNYFSWFLPKKIAFHCFNTGYIGSMGFGMNFFFGPFTSALCDRYGCRVVAMIGGIISVSAMCATSFVSSLVPIYLTYSVLWGLGSSMSFVPTFIMIDRYFERRRSLANGLITAGSAVGALVMGPTINALLERAGWRNTMRFLGGAACVLVLAALTYKAPPVKREVTKKKTLLDLSVWKNKGFVVWALALGIHNLGYFVPFVYLVSLCLPKFIKGEMSRGLRSFLLEQFLIECQK